MKKTPNQPPGPMRTGRDRFGSIDSREIRSNVRQNMKRAIVTASICIGALALVLVTVRRIGDSTPSFEKMVQDQFGSPQAIQALAALYGRVEKDGATLKPAGAKVRLIPEDWMPREFSEKWSGYFSESNEVVAYFDDNGRLSGIEFDGTRCGCYISRDPSRGPAHFSSLNRLSESPLYITGRVEE
ncbi:MAG TPA: hypothetical protein VMI53_08130 [Opitutaceae bacterium]|nr:hypothetical protein [Opitutaceae bacterium]